MSLVSSVFVLAESQLTIPYVPLLVAYRLFSAFSAPTKGGVSDRHNPFYAEIESKSRQVIDRLLSSLMLCFVFPLKP